jgi:DNA-binding NarL/FixJ family response regulator
MPPSSVLFLEDDDDLQAAVAEVVAATLNEECIGVHSYGELVALGDRALRCDVALLDINLGPRSASGIEAYRWLRRRGFGGRIVFLSGHASSHPLVVEASRIGDARVVPKPIDAGTLQAVLRGDHA